jgi:hypothetical protein
MSVITVKRRSFEAAHNITYPGIKLEQLRAGKWYHHPDPNIGARINARWEGWQLCANSTYCRLLKALHR